MILRVATAVTVVDDPGGDDELTFSRKVRTAHTVKKLEDLTGICSRLASQLLEDTVRGLGHERARAKAEAALEAARKAHREVMLGPEATSPGAAPAASPRTVTPGTARTKASAEEAETRT